MKPFGLGDLAHYLFKPAVWLIDGVWGTDLHSCEVCAARRKRWNALFSAPRWAWLSFLLTIFAMCVLWRTNE